MLRSNFVTLESPFPTSGGIERGGGGGSRRVVVSRGVVVVASTGGGGGFKVVVVVLAWFGEGSRRFGWVHALFCKVGAHRGVCIRNEDCDMVKHPLDERRAQVRCIRRDRAGQVQRGAHVPCRHRETSLLTTSGPNPLDDFSRPALRHGSLNSLFQVD